MTDALLEQTFHAAKSEHGEQRADAHRIHIPPPGRVHVSDDVVPGPPSRALPHAKQRRVKASTHDEETHPLCIHSRKPSHTYNIIEVIIQTISESASSRRSKFRYLACSVKKETQRGSEKDPARVIAPEHTI